MRADLASSSGDGNALPVGDAEEGKGSAACQQAEGSQRTVCANGSSRCGEALAQLHPPSGLARAGQVCAQQVQAQVEVRDGAQHSHDGRDLLWLLMPDIVLVEHSAGNRSGRPDRRHAFVKTFS